MTSSDVRNRTNRPSAGAAVERCDGCGLAVAGGTQACQAIFDDESAREYADVRFAARRRMVVDTYCLQHPDRYCVSAISLAAHLTGVCIAVEQGGRDLAMNAVVQRWLSTRPTLDKPALPSQRGNLTVDDLRAADDPRQHAAVAQEWAEQTWAAYADLHDLARHWIGLAGA